MNWDAIGAVGEIAGAAVVIATLVFLSRQIRQSNHIAQGQAMREIVGQFNESMLMRVFQALRESRIVFTQPLPKAHFD